MKELLKDTRKLTFTGVMLALTVVFVALTAIPTASASMAFLLFIPTIVTGIILGPKAGALMGFCAGVTTLLRAVLAPLSPFDAFFINPLVSVLPRTFIGVASYYVYKLVKTITKSNVIGDKIAIVLGGAFGAITNTALVMTMLYFIYVEDVIALAGVGFKVLLISIITTNSITECIVAALLTLPTVIAFQKINKQF